MGDPLRDRRSPRDLAASPQVFEILEEIDSFQRLASVVRDDLSALDSGKIPADWSKSTVTGRLDFGVADAEGGLATLRINVTAVVPAVCQRCLQVFDLPLSTTLAVLFRGPDDGPVETQDFEVWDLDDDVVVPIDIVDEALVMAMPLSAMHDDADYCAENRVAVATDAMDDTGEKMTTPFASLRAQMDKRT